MTRAELLVGDLILCEVLRGVRSETEASAIEAAMRAFEIVPLCDRDLAVKAAANYRFCALAGSPFGKRLTSLSARTASSAGIRYCTRTGISSRWNGSSVYEPHEG